MVDSDVSEPKIVNSLKIVKIELVCCKKVGLLVVDPRFFGAVITKELHKALISDRKDRIGIYVA